MSLRARIKKLERRPRRVRMDPELLADIVRFNEVAGSRPLRPYQAEVARAVVESIEAGRGDVLTVMMARQMGKNQLSAALEHYLLHRFAEAGGQIVKCAPTFKPQVINSKQRLERELAGPYSRGRWRGEYGYAIRLGGARVLLFSAEPGANVVGATADLLLEIDEAQNVDEEKYLRDFRPMASTTNATTVLYGTAWSEDCLLEKARQESLERQRRSGRRLHFEYPWDHLAAFNPAYGRFVEGEIARLGESHPVIRTQYLLQAVPALGRFLSIQQRALLCGRHERLREPLQGESYVAGIDVAGEDEEAADAALRAVEPRRDSTVVTIGRVWWDAERAPCLEVVEHYRWTGRDHRSQFTAALHAVRDVWACRRVVVDATGIGAGLASWLQQELSADVVEQFVFTAPSKSRLGFLLLGMINTGRCTVYAPDGSEDARALWREVELARYEMRANEVLRFFVDPSDGHDDYLMSLALCGHAADGTALPPADAVVRARPVTYDDEGPWRQKR